MAIWLIFIGTIGVLLDIPATEIVTVQALSYVAYSVVAGVLDGLALRRAMRRQRDISVQTVALVTLPPGPRTMVDREA